MGEVRVSTKALPTDPSHRAAVLELLTLRAQVTEAEAELRDRRDAFDQALLNTRKAGVTPTQLAAALGISRNRVHELVRRAGPKTKQRPRGSSPRARRRS